MLNDRLAAARSVATHLFALEDAIDTALMRAGELTSSIPAARNQANLSAVVGQDAFAEVAASLSRLVEARKHIVDAHNHLADTRDQMGLRKIMAVGDAWKSASVPQHAGLHLVEDQAA